LSDNLLKPFHIPEGENSLKNYPVRCIEFALMRIYSYYTMNRDNSEERHIDGIEGMLQYIGSVLLYIRDYPPIGNRNDYYTEVRTLLADETKVIMFYYTISKTENNLYQIFKEKGFFKFQQMENELLLSVVEMVCKENRLIEGVPFDNNSMTIDDGKDKLVESNNFWEIVNYYKMKPHKKVLLSNWKIK
jgi:hypothetical protein